MSARSLNLSGHWTGLFSYPVPHPPTRFEAILREDAGLVVGATSEFGDTPECFGLTLNATIDGRRDGHQVHFVKMYDAASEYRDVVRYAGILDVDGNEIGGWWSIPGEWSGTFLMIRSTRVSEAEERQVAEAV